jgi:hypothetical protein
MTVSAYRADARCGNIHLSDIETRTGGTGRSQRQSEAHAPDPRSQPPSPAKQHCRDFLDAGELQIGRGLKKRHAGAYAPACALTGVVPEVRSGRLPFPVLVCRVLAICLSLPFRLELDCCFLAGCVVAFGSIAVLRMASIGAEQKLMFEDGCFRFWPHSGPSRQARRTAASGGERSFAERAPDGEDAPQSDLRATRIERRHATLCRH